MKLECIISEVFVIPTSDVTDNLRLNNISTWDSMSHMVLILRLEQEFDVQLSGDQIAEMKSVGDARDALLSLGADL